MMRSAQMSSQFYECRIASQTEVHLGQLSRDGLKKAFIDAVVDDG